MYGSWDTEHDRKNVIFGYFLPFYLPNNRENQNFGKMKKNPGAIIILNMITINENHMMYDSLDMEHDRQFFFLILDHFLPFYTPVPPNNPENQNFEKLKKATGDIIILHKCTINNNHMIYGSYGMWSAPDFFLSSWAIFCPFTP